MPRPPDRRLIRYLHGELPPAEVQKLRAELAADPALQARLAELHRLWQGLQAPPPTPAPFGFVPRLQRLADEKRASTGDSLLGVSGAPAWARALVGAALAAGIALGIGLGRLPQSSSAPLGTTTPPSGVVASPTATVAPQVARQATAPSPAPAVGAPAHPSTTRIPPPAASDSDAGEVAGGASMSGGTTLAEAYWEALSGSGETGTSETDDEGNGTG